MRFVSERLCCYVSVTLILSEWRSRKSNQEGGINWLFVRQVRRPSSTQRPAALFSVAPEQYLIIKASAVRLRQLPHSDNDNAKEMTHPSLRLKRHLQWRNSQWKKRVRDASFSMLLILIPTHTPRHVPKSCCCCKRKLRVVCAKENECTQN